MAFDAGMMHAVMHEIENRCTGSRVERVCQPSKDEIVIVLHAGRENMKLSISASCNTPRISLTDENKENPIVAPMFCMLLRKQLNGGKLRYAGQVGFERVAQLVFSCYDEMGYECDRIIYAEIMGRFSNIIMTDGDGKIITALKTVDFTTSSKRQILPQMKYELPPPQNKENPLTCNGETFSALFSKYPKARETEKFITSSFLGIAPAVAREIIFRSGYGVDTLMSDIDCNRLFTSFRMWFENLENSRGVPVLILDGQIPRDYCYEKLSHLDGVYENKVCKSYAEMFDSFFGERDRIERIHSRANDILHLISSSESRLTKKIALQTEELADCEHGEEYKRNGDLITANMYRLTRKATEFSCVDYYDADCPEVTIKLDGRLSPSQNAQKMYKLYNKAKNAKKYLTEQIEIATKELEYLDSVKGFLSCAKTESDLAEIRSELYHSGYASRIKATAGMGKNPKIKPDEYRTSGGYRLIVGRNNLQNDYVTFKVADKGDLWFHVKGMPGSHVILVCGGEEPSEKDYTEAAECAAYNSTAPKNSMTEVDYTRVKNIKKPQGAKPGYVIYHQNYSAYVMPKLPLGKDDANG